MGPQCQLWDLRATESPLPWDDHTCFAILPHTGPGWTTPEGRVHVSEFRTIITIIAAISNPAPSVGQATCFTHVVKTTLRGSFANLAVVVMRPQCWDVRARSHPWKHTISVHGKVTNSTGLLMSIHIDLVSGKGSHHFRPSQGHPDNPMPYLPCSLHVTLSWCF